MFQASVKIGPANLNFSTVPFFTALWIVIFQGNFDTTVTSVLLAISLSGFHRGDSPSG